MGNEYDFEDSNTDTLEDINQSVQDVEHAVRDLETSVKKVESAINDKWNSLQAVLFLLVLLGVWSFLSDVWHSKWRYGLTYSVESDKVIIEEKPHDCDFLAAPLGNKYCDYEREVTTLLWSSSPNGPIQSFDDGKTWETFTPDPNVAVPKVSTAVKVFVFWKKVNK